MLTAIKLLHTLIWAALASCVISIPLLAIARRFRAATIVSIIIWIECAVLALNGARCPLTDWAAQFTSDRAANFDIYLPLWLAQYNKQIFGTIFLVGEVVLAVAWGVHHKLAASERKANAFDLSP